MLIFILLYLPRHRQPVQEEKGAEEEEQEEEEEEEEDDEGDDDNEDEESEEDPADYQPEGAADEAAPADENSRADLERSYNDDGDGSGERGDYYEQSGDYERYDYEGNKELSFQYRAGDVNYGSNEYNNYMYGGEEYSADQQQQAGPPAYGNSEYLQSGQAVDLPAGSELNSIFQKLQNVMKSFNFAFHGSSDGRKHSITQAQFEPTDNAVQYNFNFLG